MSMYRHKRGSRPKKSIQETKPWVYAAKLKRYEFETSVHALAFYSPKAYYFLLTLLKKSTPLERISILLHKHHASSLQLLQNRGFGIVSPHTLLTFKRGYFITDKLPDPQQERALVVKELQHMIGLAQLQRQRLDVLLEIEERSGVTLRITTKFISDAFSYQQQILDYQLKLYLKLFF